MSRIDIRGVIVPSNYDSEWAQKYIEKGVITPESRFRTALAAAPVNEPLHIYINSPGGSVFAGNEMINAINAWAAQHKQPVEITIGAMAASMAAAMLVQVRSVKVSAHNNSKIMFHGAWTETVGGEGAHRDEADLLAKINADLKTALVARFNLSPEKVDGWFAEGRMGWLDAKEAKLIGLVKEIVDADDAPQKIERGAFAMLTERGMKIAAALEPEMVEDETTEAKANEGGDKDQGETKPDSENAEGQEPEAGTGTAGSGTEGTDGPGDETVSDDVAALTDKLHEMQAQIKELDAASKSWQGRYDKAQVEIQGLKTAAIESEKAHDAAVNALKQDHEKQISGVNEKHVKECSERDSKIAGLESRLSKYTLNALGVQSGQDSDLSWPDALRKCNNDFAEAKKQYPGAHARAMLKQKKG